MSELSYKQFPVYQDALDFLSETQSLYATVPRGNGDLLDQLKRATTSIILNIAEGAGRFGKLDKRKFYLTAAGSTFECGAVLDILHRMRLIQEEDHVRMTRKLERIAVALNGLTRKLNVTA